MTEQEQTTEDEQLEALTGSGAPAEEGGLPAEEHPEPTPLGFVRQDNVSEPGVEHTHSVDGTTSSHGEPVAADAPADEQEDDGSKEPDPED